MLEVVCSALCSLFSPFVPSCSSAGQSPTAPGQKAAPTDASIQLWLTLGIYTWLEKPGQIQIKLHSYNVGSLENRVINGPVLPGSEGGPGMNGF